MRFGCKEVRDVVKFAQKNGFTLVRNKSHVILRHANGVVSVSMSPSGQYGMTNAMKDIKKLMAK